VAASYTLSTSAIGYSTYPPVSNVTVPPELVLFVPVLAYVKVFAAVVVTANVPL
jgi:hypothetical protein